MIRAFLLYIVETEQHSEKYLNYRVENVENREYYGRTATEIKNVVDIRYDKQQPLIAFVYDNDEMSVPTLDDFINSQTDFLLKNDYVYYVAFEFCK